MAGVRRMNGDGVRRDEHRRPHGSAAGVASRRPTAQPSRQQPADDPDPRSIDRLADGGSCRLGSVYYRASCPTCGQPAVWHDEAVGQLPGLTVVCTTSEVVCCTTCDGA